MIPVNKPYLPAFSKYSKYLEQAYARNWLTNNGPLVQELKLRLEDYLGVKKLNACCQRHTVYATRL